MSIQQTSRDSCLHSVPGIRKSVKCVKCSLRDSCSHATVHSYPSKIVARKMLNPKPHVSLGSEVFYRLVKTYMNKVSVPIPHMRPRLLGAGDFPETWAEAPTESPCHTCQHLSHLSDTGPLQCDALTRTHPGKLGKLCTRFKV